MRCIAPKPFFIIIGLLCMLNTLYAQYAPAAHLPGTTAISADSTIFLDWASGCSVVRGPMNIANTALGLASAGDSTKALGTADDITVSLGDGGMATLTFNRPIYNGDGFDFAVFENGFMTNNSNLAFLELGFVEVSTDGNRYVRFPATTHVQDTLQLDNDGSIDCSELYNFAGKYIGRYGTPFDLQELIDSPGLDINNINFIRIIDVVGSLDTAYASLDNAGRIINDPWPTPYPSSGFDLDGIGVIHSMGLIDIRDLTSYQLKAFPNPVNQGDNFKIQCNEPVKNTRLYNSTGQLVFGNERSSEPVTINTTGLSRGLYCLTVQGELTTYTKKVIIQ